MSNNRSAVSSCDGTAESCNGDTENCELDPAECHAYSRSTKQQSSNFSVGNAEDCLGKTLEQLSQAFMASARRWEMVVYPALFAFIILAAYGFFLIYSLTKDISRVADDMNQITKNMQQVALHVDSISENMTVMTQTMDNQLVSLNEMTYQVRGMNGSINQMRYDFSVLNNSVSRPMSFMNTFMPW